MSGERQPSAECGKVDILHLGQVLDVLYEIARKRTNAGMGGRGRFLGIGALFLSVRRRPTRLPDPPQTQPPQRPAPGPARTSPSTRGSGGHAAPQHTD